MSEKGCCTPEGSSCCSASCCEPPLLTQYDKKRDKWVSSELKTAAGRVPVIAGSLSAFDKLGTLKVRLGIGRMNYAIAPGLYAVGSPTELSPVLVSANYKLTFDTLRKELAGLSCWLLILDTNGINVWCAAGKGTFSTKELVKQVEACGLNSIVSHRRLILPQLGAPGISAHEVSRQTGFSICYGPVRAEDIKAFLYAGNIATEEMRTVRFTLRDRAVLTPVELMAAAKKSLLVFGVLFLLNLFAARPFGLYDFFAYIAAVLVGTVATPILLPFIPGRAFAFKGWLLGAVVTALLVWLFGWFSAPFLLLAVGYMLALPALAAFLAMNFTGSSTYTSFSGVIKEMKAAVPLTLCAGTLGSVLVLLKALTG